MCFNVKFYVSALVVVIIKVTVKDVGKTAKICFIATHFSFSRKFTIT